MEIRGHKVNEHYWIPCFFICSSREILKPLELLIDTGASITTVFSEFIEMDCNGLENGVPVQTANGLKSPFLLREVILIFRTTKGKLLPINLEYIDVIDMENPTLAGVLGMDVLSKFKRFTFTEKTITLVR
jgi:predicted aspartyl protease